MNGINKRRFRKTLLMMKTYKLYNLKSAIGKQRYEMKLLVANQQDR